MEVMYPKEFIDKVLIKNINDIVNDKYYYVSFAMMAIGIEFLGKCINGCDDWNKSGRSKKDFELAINELEAFKKYRVFIKEYKIWDSLRNGFLHSFKPKQTVSLSSGEEMAHLVKHQKDEVDKINLKCEDFFEDFKLACEEVKNMTEFKSNKMGMIFLNVPSVNTPVSDSSTSGANSVTMDSSWTLD